MARMNVSLEDPLIEELRHIVPTRQRSRFISEAVREKLNRLKQERAIQAAAGLWASDDRASVEEEIRTVRGTWEHRSERFGEQHD